MTRDPRILPDGELAEWEADARSVMAYFNKQLDRRGLEPEDDSADHRICRLIDHGKALAERVADLSARAEKAEAEAIEQRKRADAYRDTENTLLRSEEARADAAEQRLAGRDKAIRDLADEWDAKGIKAAGERAYLGHLDGDASHLHFARTCKNHASALRALLPEDGIR